ncbi:MAG TPA: hypothetical protein PKD31_02690, partial [Blastocatellia bacterium]|nr:hypothetical protein [Blastocatellia bacterium]
ISPALSERELAERNRIGAFLKSYVNERLRDPETRALNSSPAFRDARAALFKATKTEELGRSAAQLLRDNERQSEEWRKHYAAPQSFPPPAVLPLNRQERDLLFAGRAPAHHTSEMRELRLLYGLSRQQRAARTADLHAGKLEPSAVLKELLAELETRTTVKAISHFQAGLLNEKTNQASRLNLHELSQRLPPHERAFLYEHSEARKHSFTRSTTTERGFVEQEFNPSSQDPTARAFGAAPKQSPTFRAYLASMGHIERALLNEALQARGVSIDRTAAQPDQRGFSITEARQLLPTALQKEIRLRARNEAWQNLIPTEVFERNPAPAALRVSETIAHIQEHLQERASLAQTARDAFVSEQAKLAGNNGLPSNNAATARQLKELNQYAAATREEVYRAFENLDRLRPVMTVSRSAEGQETQFLSPVPKPEQMVRAAFIPDTQSAVATAWQRVVSNQTWHVDELRTTLMAQGRQKEEESHRPFQPEHTLTQER